jgi:hypothetical protein
MSQRQERGQVDAQNEQAGYGGSYRRDLSGLFLDGANQAVKAGGTPRGPFSQKVHSGKIAESSRQMNEILCSAQ